MEMRFRYYIYVILLSVTMLLCITGCAKESSSPLSVSDSASTVSSGTGLSDSASTVSSGTGLSDSASAASANTGLSAADEASESADTQNSPDASTTAAKDFTASSENRSTTSLAAPSTSGALRVVGTQLCDKNGSAVQLKGLSTHGLAWFPEYVNDDLFRQFHDEWNINVIRLALYTDEYGGYCSSGDQDALKNVVKCGVKYATDNDMYVIIDWHVLNDLNPNKYIEQAKTFFAEMSSLYADYNNVIYEICNEPNGGTSWSDIKQYANEIIPIIRSNSKDAVIIVGTPNWSQYVNQAAADPISGYDNIMYALHFYAATHKDDLRSTMTGAIAQGLPVFVSEFGICDASGNGAIDETEADKWLNLLDEYNISYIAWNISNKAETSAIISSSCSKTSGLSESDLSTSGKWLYRRFAKNY